MAELGRIAIYGLGIVCGIAIGASVASLLRCWARPAITVCRCPDCRAAGPHVDAVALHYDARGNVELIALCCLHTARKLWEAEECEPSGGYTAWRFPCRINGFPKRGDGDG